MYPRHRCWATLFGLLFASYAHLLQSAPIPGAGVSHGSFSPGSPSNSAGMQAMNSFTHNAYFPDYHYEPTKGQKAKGELKASQSEKVSMNREKEWLQDATHLKHAIPRPSSENMMHKKPVKFSWHLGHLSKRMLSRAFKKQEAIERPDGPASKHLPIPDNYRHISPPIDEHTPLDSGHLPDITEHEYSSSFGSHSYGSQNHRSILSDSASFDSLASTSSGLRRVYKFYDLHALGESLGRIPTKEIRAPRINFHLG
jgi:hypothetical protein